MPAMGVLGGHNGGLAAQMLRAAVVLGLLGASAPRAAEHEINTRPGQWLPVVLFVAPGDTVVFHGMSGHETELIQDLAPAGAMPWRSEIGEEGFEVVLDVRGAYIYKCHTHLRAGMIGAIVVGDASRKTSQRSRPRWPCRGDETASSTRSRSASWIVSDGSCADAARWSRSLPPARSSVCPTGATRARA